MTEQLIEACERGHNYRAAHNHETCPVDGCGARVIERYFIRVGSDAVDSPRAGNSGAGPSQ